MTTVRTLFALMFFFVIAPPANAQEATLTVDEIKLVQYTLFEWGYPVGYPDGISGPKTRKAIAQWQKYAEQTVTGVLTRAQADKLISSPLPTGWKWGAISASTDAGYGAYWNYSSGISAYNAALDECVRQSNDPDKCTTIAGFANSTGTQWIVAIKCDQDTANMTSDGIAVTRAGSYSEAYNNALESLTEDGYYSSNCYQRVAIAADGSHE